MKKFLPYILAFLALVTFGYILLQNDNRTNSAQIPDSGSLAALKSDGQIYEKSKFTKTGFTWKDSKDDEYPVYMAYTGSCFVIKTSRSGEDYRVNVIRDRHRVTRKRDDENKQFLGT